MTQSIAACPRLGRHRLPHLIGICDPSNTQWWQSLICLETSKHILQPVPEMHVQCVFLQNAWLWPDYLLKQIRHKSQGVRQLLKFESIWQRKSTRMQLKVVIGEVDFQWSNWSQVGHEARNERCPMWLVKAPSQIGFKNWGLSLLSLSSDILTGEMTGVGEFQRHVDGQIHRVYL